MGLLVQGIITAVAVWVSTVLPGVDLGGDSTTEKVVALVGVAVVFSLVNLVIKPVAKLVSLPLYILTLGLFGLVLNGLLFWFTGWLSQEVGLAFEVEGFWAGFFGAIIVSVVSAVLAFVFDRD